MEIAFGGVLVTMFLAGFGYLATELKGLRETTTKGFLDVRAEVRSEIGDLRTELKAEIKALTDRYISYLEWHQRTG